MKVLITAPLRQKTHIFEAYQKGLDGLIIPDGVEVDRFFVVNDCPEIMPHIRGANYIVANTHDKYVTTENDHLWTIALMNKMATLRDMTIRYALEHGYDYWFSIDTDVVLQPETLKALLEADKDIVSEVFWTVQPGGEWCNAWMYDQYGGLDMEWKNPGLYQVGMTGACTLVKRKVFESGARYEPIPNIVLALRGEDRHFCVRAAALGFEMWLDTHYPAVHLYTEKEYENYMRRGANA